MNHTYTNGLTRMRIPPPVVTFIFATLIAGVDYYSPSWFRLPGLFWLSFLLVVVAGIFLLPAVVQFVQSKTTVNPYTPQKSTTLVCSGVYRFSRNPMYLGMALCLVALTSYLENIFGFLFVVGFCWYMTHFQIRFEEEALLANFGSEFDDYRKRVRRWL